MTWDQLNDSMVFMILKSDFTVNSEIHRACVIAIFWHSFKIQVYFILISVNVIEWSYLEKIMWIFIKEMHGTLTFVGCPL